LAQILNQFPNNFVTSFTTQFEAPLKLRYFRLAHPARAALFSAPRPARAYKVAA
jgi:hypothetical protein